MIANISQIKQSNTSKGTFKDFTKKYSLSKTLRFELKPLPETKEFLSEFINSDTQRSKDYQELKKIIDEYHKEYIEKSLSVASLALKYIEKLDKLHNSMKKMPPKEKEQIKKESAELEKKLRKQIANRFTNQKALFGKELLEKRLSEWLENKYRGENKEDKKKIVEKFKNFSTYLKGFYENRKNMYSEKDQTTAISHRIINENFPKFSSNKWIYYNKILNFKNKPSGMGEVRG